VATKAKAVESEAPAVETADADVTEAPAKKPRAKKAAAVEEAPAAEPVTEDAPAKPKRAPKKKAEA
jgi:hypothetical protein